MISAELGKLKPAELGKLRLIMTTHPQLDVDGFSWILELSCNDSLDAPSYTYDGLRWT